MRWSGTAILPAALLAVAGSIAVWAAPQPARPAAPQPAPRLGTVPFDVNDPKIQAEARTAAALPPDAPPRGHHPANDRSGRRQVGKASVYSNRFQGRHMANRQRFHQTGHAAASKTLPLGTVAKVTDTKTGQTALVTVDDRGPFVDGRTMDVSKATARQLGITRKDGVAPVVVAPVAVPQPDGKIKPGAGALPGPAVANAK
jgi:rare lipoprotein A